MFSCLFLAGTAQAQNLQHEWSFNETGGTTAVDSISSSNITLLGGTSLGGGVLTLPGGAGNYAQFPNGILSTYSNSITIETWLTDNGGQTWARALSFGGSTAGPNNGFTHANYIDLIPTAGGAGGFWTEFNHAGTNKDAIFPTPMPVGVEEYAVIVYDAPNQTARLYLNGNQVASATGIIFHPSDLGFTYNNFLGLDQYNDSIFNGSFDEMRIWDGAVSQRYLSASAVAGPGVIINNLTPTTASLAAGPTVTMTGTEQAVVTVQLSQTGATNLLATADATNWVSSNPGVLTVSSSGVIYGVAPGTATVSATIAGIPVTSGSITVIPPVLQHEWSFNETGGATAADTIGGADITLLGSSSLGGGVLTLPGGSGNYAQFPDGILSSNYSITIETWLTDNGGQTWARAWSFGGGTTGPNTSKIGNNYIDLIPKAGGVNGMWTEFKANGVAKDIVDAGNVPLPVGSEKYIAITYDAQKQTCIMYSNGVQVAIATNITTPPASFGYTYNNYLGNDQYNDPIFNGTYDEMRIWDGARSPVYLLETAAAGPNVVITDTTPQSVAIAAGGSMLGSQTEQATVTGSFTQVAGVDLTSVATNWTSSKPSVLTVDSKGLITTISGGTATVSATVNGVTGTSPQIVVTDGPPTPTRSFTNQTAVIGDKVTFSVQATGGGLNYQWSYNSNPIQDATNASLVLTNVMLNQAGTYSLLIFNTFSSTNLSATLTVVPPLLQHEWSFNEDSGTTAVDSISSSNITLLGGTTLGGGVISLPGGAGNYAQFPNGILSTYSNSITIETWFTDSGGLTWARPWSFGGNTTPSTDFTHGNYIDLIPHAGGAGGFWTEFNHNGNTDAIDSTPIPTGVEEYALVTYEVWSHTVRLYLNGTQVAMATNVNFSPSDLGFTYNNYLGLDQYNDAIFNGTIDEMRIWNGAVSPLYAQVAATAGPGVVVTNMTPSAFNIAVTTSTIVGQTQQAAATATFSSVTGVPVNSYVTNWTSSNPAVLTVDTNGVITSVGAGSATVSGTFQGTTAQSASISVASSAPVITQQPAASETLMAGGTLRISLGVIGTPPFTYFWYFNNGASPISITTAPTLVVPNLQSGSAGSYSCVVSNQVGTTLSSSLTLAVVTPTVYQQAILALNPISYWPLNEVDGTTAFDLIGGQNGTYVGTFALGFPGPTNGFFGTSLSAGFDGNSGHVDIPGSQFNLIGAVTVVAWVNLLSAPGFDGLVGHGDSSWRLDINGSSQPGGNDANGQPDATGSVSIQDNNWHMVAYSYSGIPGQNNNGSLYVDGTLVANNTVITNPVVNNLDVWIGGSPDYANRFVPANIAQVAVFNQALTAAQVQGLYNGVAQLGPQNISITRSGTSLVLNWQSGILLQATNLLGPWTTNSAAQPGYVVPVTSPNQFFRLLVSP